GTTNYLYAIPAYAVSIAVEVDGEIVAGVVADPSHRETFAATRGGGATCNGKPIDCSTVDVLANALVGTGFSYDADRRQRQGRLTRGVRRPAHPAAGRGGRERMKWSNCLPKSQDRHGSDTAPRHPPQHHGRRARLESVDLARPDAP